MTENKKVNGKTVREYIGEFIAFFVCLDSYLLIFQVSIASRHMAVAFVLPIHNIGIYFSKLYSLSCLMMGLGAVFEYGLYLCCTDIRVYLSITSLAIKTIARLLFVIITYASKRLSFHTYIEITGEAGLLGIFQSSLFSLVPEYAPITSLSMDTSFMVACILQVLFDLSMYDKPLLMVRMQSIMRFATSFISLCLWCFFLLKFDSVFPKPENSKENEEEIEEQCNDLAAKGESPEKNISILKHFGNASSQFLMFGSTALFKEFLFPGIIPYALLERDKCHIINLSVPPFYLIGSSATLAIHKLAPGFKCWRPEFHSFWLLLLPQIFIFVISIMAIHTKIRFTRKFLGSRPRVLILTLFLMVSYCTMQSVSFVGVSDYVYYQSGDEDGSIGIVSLHYITAIIYRFVFSKLSVGYNDTRVQLGYHLPKFRPNHRMSDSNTFIYILKNTFKRSVKDAVTDFTMNIRNYL
ncbi:hypothetical protein MACK_002949 [Theileria orientalis]|uniref:Uncharacterized protein n=1 Tax=Theileria orientalis TaxID=68886 RepID=A0A976QVV3_THEOR|nr:hypothetical protein MACK_002949 [Theileria orientalis]